jgi:hypothetical protein
LDVCGRGRVTVAIEPLEGETTVYVVDPIAGKEELYQKIVDSFESPH